MWIVWSKSAESAWEQNLLTTAQSVSMYDRVWHCKVLMMYVFWFCSKNSMRYLIDPKSWLPLHFWLPASLRTVALPRVGHDMIQKARSFIRLMDIVSATGATLDLLLSELNDIMMQPICALSFISSPYLYQARSHESATGAKSDLLLSELNDMRMQPICALSIISSQ